MYLRKCNDNIHMNVYQPIESNSIYQPIESNSIYQPIESNSIYQPIESTPIYQSINWKDMNDPSVLEKEKGKREPFTPSSTPSSSFPPFLLSPSPENVSHNISTIQNIQTNYANTENILQNKSNMVKQDIVQHYNNATNMFMNNDKYHLYDNILTNGEKDEKQIHYPGDPINGAVLYDPQSDPNVLIRPEESKDIKNVIQQDVNKMKLYQNSIYITATIAGASLLIALIVFTKK